MLHAQHFLFLFHLFSFYTDENSIIRNQHKTDAQHNKTNL